MADFAKQNHLSLAGLRLEYRLAELSEANCETNPIGQFEKWFKDAEAADLKEPNAMTLATATPAGKPSSRIVLLKEFDEDGFVFYTNYSSRKGEEIRKNPLVALTFYWAELERQVRIEGKAELVSREKSEEYFRDRPKGSKLGAWASHQSEIVTDRRSLENRLAELQAEYADTEDVPTPDYWGGYLVRPKTIEFWQGRENRLHDRLLYVLNVKDGQWTVHRLSP